jgi:hypothetical protein
MKNIGSSWLPKLTFRAIGYEEPRIFMVLFSLFFVRKIVAELELGLAKVCI